MRTCKHTIEHRAGFTLLELSIVLVIIGLIVGGVLAGRDLIDAANLRATVSQLEKYNTAVNTFKLKYNALPGDIHPTKAAQFGFFQITGNCGSECSYENGFIGEGGDPDRVQEYFVFWRHLSEAKLISETMNSALLRARNGGHPSSPDGWQEGVLPAVKFSPENYFRVYRGFRYLSNGSDYIMSSHDYATAETRITPMQAYSLDAKIDDGKPNTGTVVEFKGPDEGLWATTPADGNCTYGGVDQFSIDASYNLDAAVTDGELGEYCMSLIKAGF